MPMDQESPDSAEPDEEEATPSVAEEVHPGSTVEQFPSNIVTEVLGALEPQEEVAESESGDDREESNNIPTDILEENKDKGMN